MVNKKAGRVSRRRFLRQLGCGLAGPGLLGGYVGKVEPYWVDYHEVPLAVAGLPLAFKGVRIAQLSDLHMMPGVPLDYFRGVVKRVNEGGADYVFVTGDLVTLGKGYVREACEVLSGLAGRVFVSFGNHDYGQVKEEGRSIEVSAELERRLTGMGHTVLRNRAVTVERGGAKVAIVGLEDLWSGRFSAAQAFATVEAGLATLALSHNPDTASTLEGYGAGAIFAGHTHGGQVRIPGYGALIVSIHNGQWQQGLFDVGRTKLYVSRGVGYLMPARFCCRPEVATFVLRGG